MWGCVCQSMEVTFNVNVRRMCPVSVELSRRNPYENGQGAYGIK